MPLFRKIYGSLSLNYFSTHLRQVSSQQIFSAEAKFACQKRMKDALSSKQHQRIANKIDKKSSFEISKSKKAYALLVPMICLNGQPSMIFEHRSNLMSDHRGEACFPGGRIEAGENAVQAALRESREEIGLPEDKVEVWGEMAPLLTRSMQHQVTPILGLVCDSVQLSDLTPQGSEVDEIFALPMDSLIAPENFSYTQFRIGGTKPGYSLPVYTVGERRIWGLSALVLHMALRALVPSDYKPKLKFYQHIIIQS